MRGVVICELLEELERRLGVVGAEAVLARSKPPADRVYAAHVEIPAQECVALLDAAEAAGVEREPLMRSVGARVAGRILEALPSATLGCDDVFAFYDRLPELCLAWGGEVEAERPRLSAIEAAPEFRRFAYANSFDGLTQMVGVFEEFARVFGEDVEVRAWREPSVEGFRATIVTQRRSARAA